MNRPEHVAVGVVVRAHGVRGNVIVKPLTDNPNRFERIEKVLIEREGRIGPCRVTDKTESPKGWILRFHGIDTRDEAEELKGAYILINAEELPELEEGSYYDFDLVGLEVFTVSGEKLGEITEIEKYPANDLYVVEGSAGKIKLPATREVIRKVDLDNKRMEVELLDGLEFE
jgi:16S rRNA processing protein RimM